MLSETTGVVKAQQVNCKHRYRRWCLLIKICRPYRIVFTFHENLSDEKLPEMKRTFLYFWKLKPLVTYNRMNHKYLHKFSLLNISSLIRDIACVASVSVLFRSEERPRNEILGFGRARNETRGKKWFFARPLLRNSTETLASQAIRDTALALFTFC